MFKDFCIYGHLDERDENDQSVFLNSAGVITVALPIIVAHARQIDLVL